MFSLIIENPQVLIFRHGTISCNLYFSAIYTHLRVLGPIHMNLIWSIPYLSRFPMFLWFSDVFWESKGTLGRNGLTDVLQFILKEQHFMIDEDFWK